MAGRRIPLLCLVLLGVVALTLGEALSIKSRETLDAGIQTQSHIGESVVTTLDDGDLSQKVAPSVAAGLQGLQFKVSRIARDLHLFDKHDARYVKKGSVKMASNIFDRLVLELENAARAVRKTKPSRARANAKTMLDVAAIGLQKLSVADLKVHEIRRNIRDLVDVAFNARKMPEGLPKLDKKAEINKKALKLENEESLWMQKRKFSYAASRKAVDAAIGAVEGAGGAVEELKEKKKAQMSRLLALDVHMKSQNELKARIKAEGKMKEQKVAKANKRAVESVKNNLSTKEFTKTVDSVLKPKSTAAAAKPATTSSATTTAPTTSTIPSKATTASTTAQAKKSAKKSASGQVSALLKSLQKGPGTKTKKAEAKLKANFVKAEKKAMRAVSKQPTLSREDEALLKEAAQPLSREDEALLKEAGQPLSRGDEALLKEAAQPFKISGEEVAVPLTNGP